MIRIGFVVFALASCIALLRSDPSGGAADSAEEYARRIGVILYIFFVTLICISYIVYEAYRTMRFETAERMELLEAGENNLRTTYNSLSMPLIEVDSDGRIDNVNTAVCTYLGLGRSSIIGRPIDAALCAEVGETVLEAIKQCIAHTAASGANGRGDAESRGKAFEFFTFPLSGAPNRILLMLNDVTQARAIYRRIVQENKMAAVGQLAAGVAHEIRNPLGLIRNYCYVLRKSEPGDAEIKDKALSMMENAVERSGKIIDNLLRFSRISNETRIDVNIARAIRSVISFEELTLLKKNIRIDVRCDETICVRTILESLEMILINLLINAVDAIEEEGTITIDCEEGADFLTIRVSDTGKGVPDEIKADIFNPFFTTKEAHDGSGLGLYIVYNEINKLGGGVSLENSAGGGASFVISLPVRKGTAANE